MSIFIHLLVSTLAVVITSYVLPGVEVDTFVTALVVAVILGIVNAVLKPILLFLTLPITILTLGLFTFVINAGLVLLTDYFVPGFSVKNFLWAVLFSIVLSMVNAFLSHLLKRNNYNM